MGPGSSILTITPMKPWLHIQPLALLGAALAGSGLPAAGDDALSLWTPVPIEASAGSGRDVAWGNGRFVLPAGRGVLWTGTRNGPLTEHRPGLFAELELRAVTFGDGRFVLVGASNLVAVSTNGLDWERIPYPRDNDGEPEYVRLDGVGAARGRIVVVTAETVGGTYDGTNWHRHPFSRHVSVVHGGRLGSERFVAVSGEETVSWSSDGLAWTSRRFASGNSFEGVAHGNGLFVAVTLQGRSFVSADGATWGSNGSPLPPGYSPDHVTFGGGVFFLCAGQSILTSFSGSGWTPHLLPLPGALAASGYADGVVLAAGEDGELLRSADVRPTLAGVPLPDGSAFGITLRGGMALTRWLQSASSPAGPWQDLNQVQHDGGETLYIDPIPGWRDAPSRIYRLR